MGAADDPLAERINAWARLPLAEAALAVWRFVFDERRLNDLWEQHRGRNYQRVISFATMTHLIADALLQYEGSGRRSFEKNSEAGQLDASFQAAFGKLGRLPLPVSEALLSHGTLAVRELLPAGMSRPLPASLRAFTAVLLDGKALKRVARRLKPLRGVAGGLLGGKAVAALDWATGLVVAVHTHPDGDASERPLVEGLLAHTDALPAGPRLFVGDRNYCDLVQAERFTARPGDHFLVRLHGGTGFTPDPARGPRTGTDRAGRAYEETWGWLGSASNKRRRYVRRIHLRRPGEGEDLILVTSLKDADAYPAADLLWLYHQRWDIERAFQKVTEVFGLRRLIGGTPQACIFQFAFCLLLSNIMQLLRGYIAEAQGLEAEEVSLEKLFDDVQRELVACQVVYTPAEVVGHFEAGLSAAALRGWMRERLRGVWSATWEQSARQARQEPQRNRKRTHNSVYRILRAHATQTPAPGAKQRC
jgi:hypothetical protein